MILFEKFGQLQPLNREADQVDACCAVLAQLLRRLETHGFPAERLHGDDTPLKLLNQGVSQS